MGPGEIARLRRDPAKWPSLAEKAEKAAAEKAAALEQAQLQIQLILPLPIAQPLPLPLPLP